VVTPNRQHRLWSIASSVFSHGQIFPAGFFGSIIFSQLTASILSIPFIVNLVMIIAISSVWLDGLSTNIGLRKGFEESNFLIRFTQRSIGDSSGILLSRLIPLSIILYMGLILQSYYLMIPMIIIFSVCTINNIVRTKNP
jgi:hypothetical protein